MRYDCDFNQHLRGYGLVTLTVIYYMPMPYTHVLQSFLWQTLDQRPSYPRIEQFLDHWRREIDAVIKEITIADADSLDADHVKRVDSLIHLH